jgi:phosphatidylserine/phosphatidylglycerophosphate/cardiolipin synthase-like enzyme
MSRKGLRRATVAAGAALFATALPAHAASYSAFAFNLGTTEPDIYDFINSATSTLDMTMYELSDTTAVNDLIARQQAGVQVRMILDGTRATVNQSDYDTLQAAGVTARVVLEKPGSYSSQVQEIVNAGGTVVGYSSSTGYYIHAKAIVADYGLSTQSVEAGSMNVSTNSLDNNRELGIILNDNGVANTIETAFNSDYASGTPA